jgi:hypothetical protein
MSNLLSPELMELLRFVLIFLAAMLAMGIMCIAANNGEPKL